MADLLARVVESIDRHGMLPAGSRVGIAVSGGADSVFLLHALAGLAPRRRYRLAVLHVNHGLRGVESDGDEQFVRALAGEFGLPFHGVRAIPEPGNLEQRARDARQRFFLGFLAGATLDRLATGHTRSDQAETVLFRFLRGSGTAGLSGILPVTREGLVRPLLDLGREEIRAWLLGRGLPWREDRTNADRAFARNRIRLHLLPQLAKEWNPEIEKTLAGMAEVARGEEAFWQDYLEQNHALREDGAAVLIPAAELARPAPARRMVRQAIRRVRGDLRRIDLRHVESVLELAGRERGHGRVQLPGVDVVRSFDWLRLGPPCEASPVFEFPVRVPGSYRIPAHPGAKYRLLSLEIAEPGQEYAYTVGTGLDLDRLSPDLVLRSWRPGDQYRRTGNAEAEKLKVLFQHARIPSWERAGWPILTVDGKIVWTRRFGPAAGFAALRNTERTLIVRVTEEGGQL